MPRNSKRRQDVIDQREAERFDMQKQQFADNQAANQLSMKTNQFQLNQAQKAERDRILKRKGLTFANNLKVLRTSFSMGNDQEGYNALERTFKINFIWVKGAFSEMLKAMFDDKSNITF